MHGVQLVAGCDPNAQRCDFARSQLGVPKTYKLLEDLFRCEERDVCHVLVPPNLHTQMALACLDRLCHCLVEKPLALATEEAETLLRKGLESDRLIGVNHNLVLYAVFQRLKLLIDNHELGPVRHVVVRHCLNRSLRPNLWADAIFLEPDLRSRSASHLFKCESARKREGTSRTNLRDRADQRYRSCFRLAGKPALRNRASVLFRIAPTCVSS
jgi:hypothetical protein